MFVLFFRTLARLFIGFLSLLAYMRILGTMEIAPQSASDQISNYVLGSIIGGIIYNTDLPLWQFFMAIIIWGGLSLAFYYLRDRSLRAKRIIDGPPILLMEDGTLHTKEFEKARITADDLMSRLHQQGVSYLGELDTIWLETNGHLTIVKKEDEKIAYVLIEDGQINSIDMRRAGKEERWLKEKLQNQGIVSVSDVFVAEYRQGELYVYPKKSG